MDSLLVPVVFTVAFVFLCRRAIKKLPIVFYGLVIMMDAVFIAVDPSRLPRAVALLFSMPMQRCTYAVALFAMVMFVGVLPRDSRLRACVNPIRGELSIMAALLVVGHIVRYASSYFGRLLDDSSAVAPNVYMVFAVAMALVILLALLTITSFRLVKSSMSAPVWKSVQRWAYPFFGLIYAHAAVALLPSALNGARASVEMMVFYGVLFGAYAVLRVRRMLIDRAGSHLSSEDPAKAPTPASR